ncbi:hypothetical protein ANN_04370 [Periplaneta americana]|uniref:Uncharacterized protein n=1 Tax=Periplaneta americana TaxID=6978 RepID=A0ABQ8T943_PERAM|nr:hypothetical protein ANN_04370 [Periplaneta americana]
MPETRLPRQILEWIPLGRGKRGRPRKNLDGRYKKWIEGERLGRTRLGGKRRMEEEHKNLNTLDTRRCSLHCNPVNGQKVKQEIKEGINERRNCDNGKDKNNDEEVNEDEEEEKEEEEDDILLESTAVESQLARLTVKQAASGSNPGWDKLPECGFSEVFPQSIEPELLGNFRRCPRTHLAIIITHHLRFSDV